MPLEDVATLAAHRNRGLARAVVLRAVEEAQMAGADLVFLVADENDWPKGLHRRLRFDPAGLTFGFLRRPAEDGGDASQPASRSSASAAELMQ